MANELTIDLSSISAASGYFTVEGTATTHAATFITKRTGEEGDNYTTVATVKGSVYTGSDVGESLSASSSNSYVSAITRYTLGTGADTVNTKNFASGARIDLGSGADSVVVDGNAVTLTLGAGNDTVNVVSLGTATIKDFANTDVVSVQSGSAIIGKDTVTAGQVTAATADGAATSLGVDATGATVNENAFDAAATVSGSLINLGSATDASIASSATLTGGTEANTIVVTGGTSKMEISSGDDVSVKSGMIVLGSGDAYNISVTGGEVTAIDESSVTGNKGAVVNGNTLTYGDETVSGSTVKLDGSAITVATDGTSLQAGNTYADSITVSAGKTVVTGADEGDAVKVAAGATAIVDGTSIAGGTYTKLESGYSVSANTYVNGALYSTATTFDSLGNTTTAANGTTPTGNSLTNGTTATTNDDGTITLGNTVDSVGATAAISQDSVTVTATEHDDVVTLSGSHATLNAGAGADAITSSGKYNTVNGGAGADTLTVTNGGTTNFADSGADDVVKVTSGTAVLSNGSSIKSGMVTYDSTGTSYTAAAGTSINNSAVTGGTATVAGTGITLGKGTSYTAGDSIISNITADAAGSFIAITADAVTDTITLGSGKDTISLGQGVSYDQLSGLTGKDSVDVVLTTTGSITNGDATDDSLSVTVDGVPHTATIADGNYYQYTDAAGKAYAWANPKEAATIDYSSLKTPAVINTSTNDSIGDVVTGGAAADTVYAWSNDTVNASRGGDQIYLTDSLGNKAENVTIGLGEKQDTVSVTGFRTGFDSAAGTLSIDPDAAAGQISVNAANQLTVLENGTQLVFTDVSVPSGTGVDMKFSNNGDSQNWQIVNGSATLDDDASIIYGVNGKSSTIVLDNNAETVSGYGIDLSNNKQLGDTRVYANVAAVDATAEKAAVTLFGAAATRNTLIGSATAATSLWGGEGGNDVLQASGGDTTFFYRGDKDGEDSIVGYNYESSLGGYGDIVEITDGKAFTVTREGTNTVLNFGQGADSVANKLTIVSRGTGVQTLRYKWNDAEERVEIGQTNSKNTFVYDTDIDIYASGTKSDTISVTGGSTDATILLDGSTVGDMKQASYGDKINTIDAHESTGTVFLAGAAGNDTIRGSQGDATLFGGAGDDVLYGNSTGVKETTFYFGTGCGNDTIVSSNSTDKVMLYNANSTDVTGASVSGASLTLTLTDGSTLTVKNYATSCNTFVFADGASGTYDKSSKSMQYSQKA